MKQPWNRLASGYPRRDRYDSKLAQRNPGPLTGPRPEVFRRNSLAAASPGVPLQSHAFQERGLMPPAPEAQQTSLGD
jgi:hypothetical protein